MSYSQRAVAARADGQYWSHQQSPEQATQQPTSLQNTSLFSRFQESLIAVLSLALQARLMFIGGIALNQRPQDPG